MPLRALPRFGLVAALLGTLLGVVWVIFGGPDLLFPALAPVDFARARLPNTQFLTRRADGCGDASQEQWQILAAEPGREALFSEALTQATSPAAQLAALAGIWGTNPTRAADLADSLSEGHAETVVLGLEWRDRELTWDSATVLLRAGALTRAYAGPMEERPLCGS